MKMTAAETWVEFWDRPSTAIYVNSRNLEAHFESLRDGLLPHMPAGGRVLDYGCGDALAAGALAERCASLALYDAAPTVRHRLAGRYGRHRSIRVLDEEGLAREPAGSFNLIVAVSLVQYLDRAALPALLARWHRLLAPGGRLVLADVVPPHTPILKDVGSQLDLARRNGFLLAALAGLAKLAFSDYRRLRRTAGFATYEAGEILRLLADSGFAAERLPRNIGPTPHRLSFLARRPALG